MSAFSADPVSDLDLTVGLGEPLPGQTRRCATRLIIRRATDGPFAEPHAAEQASIHSIGGRGHLHMLFCKCMKYRMNTSGLALARSINNV